MKSNAGENTKETSEIVEQLKVEMLGARNISLLKENERLGAELLGLQMRLASRRYRLADRLWNLMTTGVTGKLMLPVVKLLRRAR